MGSKEGATQDIFAAHLGTRLESAEAYVGVTGRPLSLKAMQMLEVTGGDAGGETQLTELSLPRAANPLSLSAIPPAHPPGCAAAGTR